MTEPAEKPSKTQLKSQMTALQKLGEQLVNLSDAELAKIPLEPLLLKAIHEARQFKSHGAIRRQLQYIGKLMRNYDASLIQIALENMQLKSQQGKAQFHQIERWRDQLIAEGDTQLQVFLSKFPDSDSQLLRQMIRNAQQDKKGAAKKLFQYLNEIISA